VSRLTDGVRGTQTSDIEGVCSVKKTSHYLVKSSLDLIQDEMVPPKQMFELHRIQKAKSCKLIEFPQAHHMDAYDTEPQKYFTALAEFVNTTMAL